MLTQGWFFFSSAFSQGKNCTTTVPESAHLVPLQISLHRTTSDNLGICLKNWGPRQTERCSIEKGHFYNFHIIVSNMVLNIHFDSITNRLPTAILALWAKLTMQTTLKATLPASTAKSSNRRKIRQKNPQNPILELLDKQGKTALLNTNGGIFRNGFL